MVKKCLSVPVSKVTRTCVTKSRTLSRVEGLGCRACTTKRRMFTSSKAQNPYVDKFKGIKRHENPHVEFEAASK